MKRSSFFKIIAYLVVLGAVSATLGNDILNSTKPNLFSLVLTHFSGYLFFILMPVELVFLYFLNYEYNEYYLVFLCVLTATLAQTINYFIGYFITAKYAEDFISHKKFVKIKKYIKKHQNITVFIINLSTLPSPLVHLAAGMIKLSYFRTIFFAILGLTLKYLIILVLFKYSIIVIS